MNVNLELYRVFYFVTKEGSISKAARELYISQPAVSQSIKQLEEKLGGQLFFRTPKGMKLTGEGEVLYKYIDQAYNFIMTAESKFSEMQNLLAGEVKIGASDMSCKYYLLPYLETFHQRYPQIKIKITSGPSPETISLLKKGIIDFGVISLPVEDDEHLEVKEMMSIQDCFVVGEGHRELAEREISLRDLTDYAILLLEKESNTRRYIDHYTESYGYRLIPEIELATSDMLVQFAKKGLGVACVVRNFAEEELEKKTLYELKLKEPIPPRKLGVVTLVNVPLSAAAKRFLGLL